MLDPRAYRAHRHGSPFWASAPQLKPLIDGRGTHLGYTEDGRYALRHPSQGGIATIGGARSGKGAAVCIPQLLGAGFGLHPPPLLLSDPAGQNVAVTIACQGPLLGRPLYCFNPAGLHPGILPRHTCNPLSFLKPSSPTLFTDCTLIAQMCITASGGGDSRFWEDYARRLVRMALYWLTLSEGGVSLPRMWEFLRDITISQTLFDSAVAEMSAGKAANADMRADALELADLKEKGERTYAGIIGTLKNELGILADPLLQKALSGGDFSLEYLVNPALCPLGPPVIACVVPGDYKHTWRSITRVFMGIGMLHARRNTNRAIRPYVLIDEAGALGFAEFLLTALSEDAKFYSTQAIFQAISQIIRHYDLAGARELLASCEVLQIIAAGEQDTAELVSSMLGNMTLDVVDPGHRDERLHSMRSALRSMLLYDVPLMETWLTARHEQHQSGKPQFMPRALLTPDEVMRMPSDKQILFVRGGYPPILAEKRPYWLDPNMSGYLPDPFHPPLNRVKVQGRLGSTWRRVVVSDVPKKWRDWPQYQLGKFWSWT